MRVPQFNLRALMTVVAVTGMLLGGCSILQRRQAHFRALADYHESRSAVIFEGSGGEIRVYNALGEEIGAYDAFGEEIRGAAHIRESEQHARLWRRYERAASRPWMPILNMIDQ
jgi:hypothetical protein